MVVDDDNMREQWESKGGYFDEDNCNEALYSNHWRLEVNDGVLFVLLLLLHKVKPEICTQTAVVVCCSVVNSNNSCS